MNAPRTVTRLFCAKARSPHQVGAVNADEQGWRVDYTGAVHGGDTRGEPRTWRPTDEAAAAAEAWCRHCGMVLPIMLSNVLAQAQNGDRVVKLHAEGMWRDPIRVLGGKRRHKG